MVSFAHPWALLLLFSLTLLLRGGFGRSRRPALAFPLTVECQSLPRGQADKARRWSRILFAATALTTAFALAGPRWRNLHDPLISDGISLAIVVDVSGSMATPDFSWAGQTVSRLEGVQRVFRLLIAGGTSSEGLTFPGRPQDLVSLVTFAARPETPCPLTLDHRALLQLLDSQKPRTLITEATTNPGDALAWALHALQKAPTQRKAIIFLTDGESNVPPPALTPRQAGQLAVNLGIPIHTLDALSDSDTSIDAPKARQTLVDLARMTGGHAFRASDGAALQRALHDLDRLERDAISGIEQSPYHDATPWFALLALTTGSLLLGLQTTRWSILP